MKHNIRHTRGIENLADISRALKVIEEIVFQAAINGFITGDQLANMDEAARIDIMGRANPEAFLPYTDG